ncbi:S1C family serine protease [Pseudosporangium ferrugineum]|uniref:Trypsin-like peptidase n=1 Tax=Pseudosporangium ferrugineum TaxID=439699 RepID=A0A2T0SCV0_9ACTN|nr:trypsin-like peptidase domain-containing protein [Pseudosporangium ferrugineum]PRY31259.1 trypsin-like peptidase [Pseudosporangium ferrugineum]
MSGLGSPRGPEFVSPGLAGPPPAPSTAAAAAARTPRKWPLLAAAGLAIVGISAGTGGAAGYVTGRDDAAPPAPAPAPPPPGVPSDLVAAAARALPGVVSVQVRTGSGGASGSGFVFDDRGHIVTNHHVVGAAGGTVSVVGSDGRRLTAEVVGTDPGSDIAVLRVEPSAALRPLDLAGPGGTRVGEPVLAVGSPLGLSGTVTAGIVSALDRQVRLGGTVRRTAVQTDASINPGNSGGPLVNARGEVIGVNTAIATLEGGGSIGIGFAVPVEQARQVAATLIGRG